MQADILENTQGFFQVGIFVEIVPFLTMYSRDRCVSSVGKNTWSLLKLGKRFNSNSISAIALGFFVSLLLFFKLC